MPATTSAYSARSVALRCSPAIFNRHAGEQPFFSDGWLDTGDLGRVDRDGFVWVTGRAKELIKRGGHGIDPGMIENALAAHDSVAVAAAVGRPDAYAGEIPVADVQLHPGAAADEAELLAPAHRSASRSAPRSRRRSSSSFRNCRSPPSARCTSSRSNWISRNASSNASSTPSLAPTMMASVAIFPHPRHGFSSFTCAAAAQHVQPIEDALGAFAFAFEVYLLPTRFS